MPYADSNGVKLYYEEAGRGGQPGLGARRRRPGLNPSSDPSATKGS